MVRNLALALVVVSLMGCAAKENSAICSTPESLNEALKLPHDYANQITKVDSCLHRWAFRLSGATGSINEVAQAAVGGCRDMFDVETNLYVLENKLPRDQATSDRIEEKFRSDALEMSRFYVAMARAGKCAIP
jgi:hypothetical protein